MGRLFSLLRLHSRALYYWEEHCSNFQVSHEMRWYNPTDVDISLYEEELKRVEINAEVWRGHAVEAYLDRVGFLTRIVHLDRREMQKHHILKSLTRAQVIEQSKKGSSKFYPEFESCLSIYLSMCSNKVGSKLCL